MLCPPRLSSDLPWPARPDAYSAAVGNPGSAVSDDGDARVGLSDKLDVLVVARLLLQLGAGRAGQLGVDRGRGVGGLLRRDAARAGVRAQYLHVVRVEAQPLDQEVDERSEEHTSELQSLMRISYAVFCFK